MSNRSTCTKADSHVSGIKFEDFGAIHEEMILENEPIAVDNEKLKASVRWIHYADSKWVLSIRNMEAQNVLKRQITSAKVLLLPVDEANTKTVNDACHNAKPWTYETFQPLEETKENALYTCLEGVPSQTETPFILKLDHPEQTTCLGIGLYSSEKTKRKRYKIAITQLLLLDTKADSIYNMKNVTFEGDYEP